MHLPDSKKRNRGRRGRKKSKQKHAKRVKQEKKEKKKREVPPVEDRELRKELAARLLSKVDKHLRGKFPRKYYLADGKTLNEDKLELVALPVITQTLGKSSNPQLVLKCFDMCKSIVKQRRAYVKRKPGTPIKQVIVVSGPEDDSSACERNSSPEDEDDVDKLFEGSEENDEDDSEQDEDDSEKDEDDSEKDEDDSEKDEDDSEQDEADNSDDSDYHNKTVDKEAPRRAVKKRCQGKDCNVLLAIGDCFPKVGNYQMLLKLVDVIKFSKFY
jgi:cobalamin biosynthesis protein CobT